jgi:hypothetical protein
MRRTVATLSTLVLFALTARAEDKNSDDFITKPGTYKLYGGKLVVTVTKRETGTGYMLGRPTDKGSFVEQGSTKDAIKNGADWFIYTESADRVWVFTGTELDLWELGDGRSKATSASVVPKIVRAAPEPVRDRLPEVFRKKYADK